MTDSATSWDANTGKGRDCEWPESPVVYLTVDYECDYGTALTENTYGALEETPWLASLLECLDVPLTCFVQTEVLEEKPEQLERLRTADVPVTFHPHSHTHRPRGETDIGEEVAVSTAVYEEFFGRSPVGYRFPNGNIRPSDYEQLAEHGYEFDASVFPSWRPGHFDNRGAPTRPKYLSEYDLFEIPFTVYSDRVRVPTALSYCRLLGRPFTELLLRRPPPVIIFNIHMHDIVNPSAFAELSPLYRGIYSRNRDSKELFASSLERLHSMEFEFHQIDDAHTALRNQ
ncbi:polysaccharide deacetylase family protein [Halobacterium bonnevillei]|uniref:Polysaccharide deacetylase family protein n=1 Tax=Halobacterium bonnevillei TaxID=2692200 RepID=A0A6B0SDJ1_9EURY|nr:polysaccharide deacetylase family protein [Halobacterium bonnevillei]MXR19468.1 polysaccharide deacetylase family protein [Halobacterium bonnevillei]